MSTLELYSKVCMFVNWRACRIWIECVHIGALANFAVISLFLQGARVWIPHKELVWIGGELTKDIEDRILEILLEDGRVSEKNCSCYLTISVK